MITPTKLVQPTRVAGGKGENEDQYSAVCNVQHMNSLDVRC